MTTPVALAAAAAALAAGSGILARPRTQCAPPRLRAMAHLTGLVGTALLPAGAAVCAGAGLLRAATGSPLPGADCTFGPAGASWTLAAITLALAALLPLAWHGARLLTAARRTELDGPALAAATPRPLRDGGTVWILPAAEPAAYACGLRHPRAVVTSGLLALLDPDEQRAALEHEGAHVRLGHPRLLLLAATVGTAYGFLPPVRRAMAGLRRELEAAADDEAARVAGAGPLISALARVTLARAPGAAAGFADPEHLRYRIARLQQPREADHRAGALAALGAALLLAAFTWAACLLAVGAPAIAGLAACSAAVTAVAARPLWPWPSTRGNGRQ